MKKESIQNVEIKNYKINWKFYIIIDKRNSNKIETYQHSYTKTSIDSIRKCIYSDLTQVNRALNECYDTYLREQWVNNLLSSNDYRYKKENKKEKEQWIQDNFEIKLKEIEL